MASYKLVFRRPVAQDLRPILNTDVVARVLEGVSMLANDPRPVGSETLSGQERYRIGQGIYRIVYQIVSDLLIGTVVTIGRRKHGYKP
ncbi:type II toxin-antitoxin system RelE family toxin [Salinisphaera aquimarina]|uniref:Type II toxin-antitoxin system RelE/ParE family toxin n=1 Tax=Salinisphaera aquimarina TaxID=2094031 RepID=A0ABV7ELL8_9GAMM